MRVTLELGKGSLAIIGELTRRREKLDGTRPTGSEIVQTALAFLMARENGSTNGTESEAA